MYNLDDMQRIGVPKEVGVADLELWLNKRDVFTGVPGHILPLQRCVMVLLGMAQEIGANGVSVAQLWRPHAVKYLAAHPE